MSRPGELTEDEPSPFEEALIRFEAEVGRREPRRVSLDEIVEVIRADREAVDR